jgi:hypothetical protein
MFDFAGLLIVYFFLLGPLVSWVMVAGALRKISGSRLQRRLRFWIGLTIAWGCVIAVALLLIADIRLSGAFLAAWSSTTFLPSLLALPFVGGEGWTEGESRHSVSSGERYPGY